MKYMKRANIYKNHNGSNKFNPETFEAHSYDWWCYVKDFSGVKVFNDYRYSNTTAKHQNNMRSLLEDLGERLDTYWMIEAPDGLQDLESAKQHYIRLIKNLESQIAKPRTHKAKNEERRALIRQHKTKIEMIERLMKQKAD